MPHAHPLLYEINTRCWLRELAVRQGREVTLANVPEAEFEAWRQAGFSHLWLMGVWATSTASRAHSRRNPEVLRSAAELLPDFSEEDICGSPYAIGNYTVPHALGGDAALLAFRRQLNAQGMKLLVDFVPNHAGLSNVWLKENPALFLQTEARHPQAASTLRRGKLWWIAHGRDPYFPPWTDTLQWELRNPATRVRLIGLLRRIAELADGVRCDMAMLVLNEVFARTWASHPWEGPQAAGEFWSEAIGSIKADWPEFLFLAEAYWGLESRLQELGFDYTYDKTLYDTLVHRKSTEAAAHPGRQNGEFHARSAHFLENHDEPRVASLLNISEHRAAALAVLGLPGMRFLHEGQLAGARQRASVHLGRRASEAVDPKVLSLYAKLLATLKHSAVGRGEARVLEAQPAWADNPTHAHFVLVQWQADPGSFDLVAVNLAPHRAQCRALLALPELTGRDWTMKDRLGEEAYVRHGDELGSAGLFLDLPAHGAQVFDFRAQNGGTAA